MTLNQLQTLTEDELCLVLYVVNQLSPAVAPPPPYEPDHLTWWKHNVLVQKMLDVFPQIKPEAHFIYSSLMMKLGVKVEINTVPPMPETFKQTPHVANAESSTTGSV